MKEIKINLVYYSLEELFAKDERIEKLIKDYLKINPTSIIEKTETTIYFGAYEYVLEIKLFERERTEIS